MLKQEIEAHLDEELAQIISYLTFDGHLAEDLKCFYLSSKNLETLSHFARLVQRKFLMQGRLERDDNRYGESYKYRVFSRPVCRFFEKAGAPKGNKTTKIFHVPEWVKSDKECARAYLRTAFDCEGSIWMEDKPKIRFGIFKRKELMENGFEFTEELKTLLLEFDVLTSKVWLMKGNTKENGVVTIGFYFKIRQDSIPTYACEIGFNDRFKNPLLIPWTGLSHGYPSMGLLRKHEAIG